jgi:hypothetical protein
MAALARRDSSWRRGSRALEAAALLVATHIGLRASPRKIAARVLRRAQVPDGSVADEARARDVAAVVERMARWTGNPTCLSQAVTGWLMLRRRGIAASVRVGARRDDAGVHMHAWLDVGGACLIGGVEASRFVPFTRRP